MSGDNRVWGRGWYFENVAVDPTNPDIVFVPNSAAKSAFRKGVASIVQVATGVAIYRR